MADDDRILSGTLGNIIKFCETNNFLAAFANCICNDNMKHPLYDIKTDIFSTSNHSFMEKFVGQILPHQCLPLLPYYSGILINVEEIQKLQPADQRNRFAGTLHQYVGTIWNAILSEESNLPSVILAKPAVLIAMGTQKSWTDGYKELIEIGVPKFYRMLNLTEEEKNELLSFYQSQYADEILNNIKRSSKISHRIVRKLRSLLLRGSK